MKLVFFFFFLRLLVSIQWGLYVPNIWLEWLDGNIYVYYPLLRLFDMSQPDLTPFSCTWLVSLIALRLLNLTAEFCCDSFVCFTSLINWLLHLNFCLKLVKLKLPSGYLYLKLYIFHLVCVIDASTCACTDNLTICPHLNLFSTQCQLWLFENFVWERDSKFAFHVCFSSVNWLFWGSDILMMYWIASHADRREEKQSHLCKHNFKSDATVTGAGRCFATSKLMQSSRAQIESIQNQEEQNQYS